MNIPGAAVATALTLLVTTTSWAYGGKVIRQLPCPVDEPLGMSARGDHLWLTDLGTRTIVQIRKSDGKVMAKLPTGGLMPTGLAWQGDTLFSADRRQDFIARRRPDSPTNLSPIPYYEKWPTGLAHDGKHLWVVDSRKRKIHQLDPDDGTTIASFTAPAGGPTGIAFDGQYLWVADHKTEEIYRLDRRDGKVLTIIAAPAAYPSALAADQDGLWVADYRTRRLYLLAFPDQTPYVEDKPRRIRARFSVIYRAKGTGKIADLVAFLAEPPAEIPGQHRLGGIDYRPQPDRMVVDKWGQKVAVFNIGQLSPGQTTTIEWEADFELRRIRYQIVPETVDGTRMPPLDDYLRDDKKYDLQAPVLTELVTKITANQPGTYGRARAIYEHLTKVIEYDRSGGWNNAARVLARGTGSCSEYTFALVGLLRRAGIPARYVGAVSERSGNAGFDDVFHPWAEAYLPGYGWVPLDANAGHGGSPAKRGSYFGGRSNRHVVTTIGGGASEYLDWTYNHHETYRTVDNATLEIRPIARYRPLKRTKSALKSAAPAVFAPKLTAPNRPGASQPAKDGRQGSGANGWLVAIALLGTAAIGIAIGRLSKKQER